MLYTKYDFLKDQVIFFYLTNILVIFYRYINKIIFKILDIFIISPDKLILIIIVNYFYNNISLKMLIFALISINS